MENDNDEIFIQAKEFPEVTDPITKDKLAYLTTTSEVLRKILKDDIIEDLGIAIGSEMELVGSSRDHGADPGIAKQHKIEAIEKLKTESQAFFDRMKKVQTEIGDLCGKFVSNLQGVMDDPNKMALSPIPQFLGFTDEDKELWKKLKAIAIELEAAGKEPQSTSIAKDLEKKYTELEQPAKEKFTYNYLASVANQVGFRLMGKNVNDLLIKMDEILSNVETQFRSNDQILPFLSDKQNTYFKLKELQEKLTSYEESWSFKIGLLFGLKSHKEIEDMYKKLGDSADKLSKLSQFGSAAVLKNPEILSEKAKKFAEIDMEKLEKEVKSTTSLFHSRH